MRREGFFSRLKGVLQLSGEPTFMQESLLWYWIVTYGSEWILSLDLPLLGEALGSVIESKFGRDIVIADIGCGIGNYMRPLVSRGFKCYGCDVSYALLNESTGLQVQQASVLFLPYRDESFDLVLCLNVLEHIPEPLVYKALFQLKRITKKSGLLVLAIPGDEPDPYYEIYLDDESGLPAAGHLTLAGPNWWYSLFDLLELKPDHSILPELEENPCKFFTPSHVYVLRRT